MLGDPHPGCASLAASLHSQWRRIRILPARAGFLDRQQAQRPRSDVGEDRHRQGRESGKSVDQNSFGVVWLSARTETDKDARTVTLDNITFERANFPADPSKADDYLKLAQSVATGTDLVVDLDQIEAGLATPIRGIQWRRCRSTTRRPRYPLLFAPAVLVPVEACRYGSPTSVAGVEFRDQHALVLLRYQEPRLSGLWRPLGQRRVAGRTMERSGDRAHAVEPGDASGHRRQSRARAERVPADIAEAFKSGQFPAVYVRTHTAELIPVDGQPQFAAIPGTSLSYVNNTAADVFVNQTNNAWYRADLRPLVHRFVQQRTLDLCRAQCPSRRFRQDSRRQSQERGAGVGGRNAGSAGSADRQFRSPDRDGGQDKGELHRAL